MEQPQMGTEEVCYLKLWPKTEYMTEMQQFKCEVCSIRQKFENIKQNYIVGITWLDIQK